MPAGLPHLHPDWSDLVRSLLVERAITLIRLDPQGSVLHIRSEEVVPDGHRSDAIASILPKSDPAYAGICAIVWAFGTHDDTPSMELRIESALSAFDGWQSCVIAPHAPTRRLLLRVA